MGPLWRWYRRGVCAYGGRDCWWFLVDVGKGMDPRDRQKAEVQRHESSFQSKMEHLLSEARDGPKCNARRLCFDQNPNVLFSPSNTPTPSRTRRLKRPTGAHRWAVFRVPQITFVHHWYPELVPKLHEMLPQSAFGRWLHRYFLRTIEHSGKEPKQEFDPRGCLFVKRSQMRLLMQEHKYLGLIFHSIGSDFTTPQQMWSITTMVFTVGFLVCGACRGVIMGGRDEGRKEGGSQGGREGVWEFGSAGVVEGGSLGGRQAGRQGGI